MFTDSYRNILYYMGLKAVLYSSQIPSIHTAVAHVTSDEAAVG